VLRKDEVLKDISGTIRQLERLASQKMTWFRKPSRQNAKIYSRIRKDAIDLHDTLLEAFSDQQYCHCPAQHNVNLRLERISKQKSNLASSRFSVLLSFDVCSGEQRAPWEWREVEFEPIGYHDGLAIACKATELLATPTTIEITTAISAQAPEKPLKRRREIFLEPTRDIVRSVSSAMRSRNSSPVPPIQA